MVYYYYYLLLFRVLAEVWGWQSPIRFPTTMWWNFLLPTKTSCWFISI